MASSPFLKISSIDVYTVTDVALEWNIQNILFWWLFVICMVLFLEVVKKDKN